MFDQMFRFPESQRGDAATTRSRIHESRCRERLSSIHAYDAEESVELPNGGPMIQGKTNIAKGMSFLDDNHNRLIGTPVRADISSWGDLAFTLGAT